MSDTPRTDGVLWPGGEEGPTEAMPFTEHRGGTEFGEPTMAVPASLARELETELAEARAELDTLKTRLAVEAVAQRDRAATDPLSYLDAKDWADWLDSLLEGTDHAE